MALYNRVKVTITAGGTGNLTLGSPVGMFQGFGDAGVPVGTVVSYVIEDPVTSTWEYGRGTYTGSLAFARTTVMATSAGGTAPINAGTAAVLFIDALAEDFMSFAVGIGITGGTTNRVLFDNGGTLGEAANLTYDGTATSVRQLKFTGATSGAVTVQSQPIAGTYSLTLPNAAPAIAGQTLVSDTSGNLAWYTDVLRPFDPAATYAVNDLVYDNGKVYRSIAGSAAAAWDATKWTVIADAAQAFTAGSIPFADTGGALTEDNAALFFNKTNKQLYTDNDAFISKITVGRGGGKMLGNVAFGNIALRDNTTGNNQVAIGNGALTSNTTGSGCVAIGDVSQHASKTAQFNISIGAATLSASTSDRNACVGYGSMSTQTTGGFNTAGGFYSLGANVAGNNCVAFGYQALRNSLGNANCGLGYSAGSAITTGAGNVVIGGNAGEAAMNETIILSTGTGVERARATSTGAWLIGTTTAPTDANVKILVNGSIALVGKTTAAIKALATPAKGSIEFSTDANALAYFDGTAWQKLSATPL